MCCRIHSYGTDLRSRCQGALLQGLEDQALEEHESGAPTLEESDGVKRARRDVEPWDGLEAKVPMNALEAEG